MHFLKEIISIDLIIKNVASEKNPDIQFYSGFRGKNTRGGGAIRNPSRSIDLDLQENLSRGGGGCKYNS